MRLSDRQIDSLLARGDLSGPESDRILEQVLARRARGSGWRRVWIALGAGLSLAAAAAGVVLVGRGNGRPDGTSGQFAARGAAMNGAVADLQAACIGGSLTACPRGATLLFAVRGGSPGGHLSAWAEPAGGGERVWYFSADGESPRLPGTEFGSQALSRGVQIGPEHATGAYAVHLLLSDRPLPQSALIGAHPPGVLAETTLALTVVEKVAP